MINEIEASIPLSLIHGQWMLNGIQIEKGTQNVTTIENQIIKTHMTNNKLDITNESSQSRYYLYSINMTSFLFENNGTSHDTEFLEYPFIFTVFPHNNVFFSSFKARGDTWVDIMFTNRASTLTISVYSPTSTTILLGTKKIEDNRSIFRKYYLLFLVIFYFIIFIIPNYLINSIEKVMIKRKVSKSHCTNINITINKKVN